MPHNYPSSFEEQTSRLGKSLEGLKFPADKYTIISFAHSNKLDSYTLSIITNLPERPYLDLRDVLAHFIGGTCRTEI